MWEIRIHEDRSEMRAKTTTKLKQQAWKLLSQIIRQDAADHRGMCQCFTCDEWDHWKSMQAGHGIGGRHNAVLLDEDILRVQCVACNIFKRGNYTIFTTKLIKENGLEWWDNKLAESRLMKKYTRAELIEKIEEYKSRLSVIERSKKWQKEVA